MGESLRFIDTSVNGTVSSAVEMMGFGADAKGVEAFGRSPSLLGDLGSSYVGSWVGHVITLGAAISAFGCCLACMVGASRLLFALVRDTMGGRGPGRVSRAGTPAIAAGQVAAGMVVIVALCVA